MEKLGKRSFWTALKLLMTSRKFLLALAGWIACGIAYYLGGITVVQFIDATVYLVMTLIAAIAAEDVAFKIGGGQI